MVHTDGFTASSVSNARARCVTLAGEFDLCTAPLLRTDARATGVSGDRMKLEPNRRNS